MAERTPILQAAREREALIRSVLGHLPQAVVYQIEAQPGGARHFTYLSGAVTVLFACTPEEAIANPQRIYGTFAEEDRERVAAEEERCLRELVPFNCEIRIRARAREERWIYASSAPRRRGDGTIIWDGVIVDVTERKRAEDALRNADRAKNEFLAVLSHELRNPLAPIKNSLYILERAVPGSEEAQRAQAIVARQVDQLSRLVDDLLDVTRIARKKLTLQRSRLELGQLVRRTLEDYRPVFEKADVRLELETAPVPVLVDADAHRIAQVLGNLLQNAAKFTPPGGRVTVTVAADAPAGRAVVSVADTGLGLTPEMTAHVFEPFTQVAEALDRSEGSFSLGLALVKGVVELHGGEVSANSAGPGQGSRFVVRLPLDVSEPAPVERTATATRGCHRRVLVIEDDVDSAASLRDMLEIQGHEVAVAHDGAAGIAMAREFHPEVVLCDIGLPGVDGYEVARAFRDDEALRGAQLVALSGFALAEELQRASEAGFERHLTKPPSFEKLASVLAGL